MIFTDGFLTQIVGKNSDCHVIELNRNTCISSLEIAIHKEYLPSEFLKSGMETWMGSCLKSDHRKKLSNCYVITPLFLSPGGWQSSFFDFSFVTYFNYEATSYFRLPCFGHFSSTIWHLGVSLCARGVFFAHMLAYKIEITILWALHLWKFEHVAE